MTERKGLSQILYLIIAASVLMMVALSLIFMFNDSVSGSTGDAQACTTALDTQCSVSGAERVKAPGNCLTDASGEQELISAIASRDEGNDADDGTPYLTCPGNEE